MEVGGPASVMPLVGGQGLLGGGPCPQLAHRLAHQVGEGGATLDQGVQGLLHTGIVEVDPPGRGGRPRGCSVARGRWPVLVQRLGLLRRRCSRADIPGRAWVAGELGALALGPLLGLG